MKKLKGFKSLRDKFVDRVNELDIELQNEIKNIKKEHQQQVVEEKLHLLIKIANDYKLDLNEMKTKYLKPRELNMIQIQQIQYPSNIITEEEELLDKIEIKGTFYWIDKEKKVYDTESKHIGVYENDKIIFNKL